MTNTINKTLVLEQIRHKEECSFMKSQYREIRSNFIDYDKNIMYIDAWRTTSSNEEGKVIAKINLANSEVEYVDEKAKTDAYAQTVIRRVLNAMV